MKLLVDIGASVLLHQQLHFLIYILLLSITMGTTIMSYINNNDMEKGTVNIMDYDGTHLLLCIY